MKNNPYPFGSKILFNNKIGTVIDPSSIWENEDRCDSGAYILVEFNDKILGSFERDEDNLLLKEGKFYRYFPAISEKIKLFETAKSVVKIENLRCIHCREGNDYAKPNMTDNRFCCHACRDAEGWRYREFYLEGVK